MNMKKQKELFKEGEFSLFYINYSKITGFKLRTLTLNYSTVDDFQIKIVNFSENSYENIIELLVFNVKI